MADESDLQLKRPNVPKKKMKQQESPTLDHLPKKIKKVEPDVIPKNPPTSTEPDLLVPKKSAPKKNTSTKKTLASQPDSDNQEKNTIKPSTASMVTAALKELKSRKGSSLYAIKKYMADKYGVDPDKTAYLIKKYLKSAIEKGEIVQIKGIGATGSFKLDPKIKKPKKKIEKATDEQVKKTKPKMEKKKEEKPKKVQTVQDKDNKKSAKFSKETKSPKRTTKGPQAKRKSIGSIVKAPQMKPMTPKRKLKKQKTV